MKSNHDRVIKNDVARPGRTASLVLVVFDESPQGTDGSQFESLPGTSGNIIPGRAASTGPHEGGPNSVGPQPASVRLWTPLAAPSFARGYPWTPRACRSPAGSPAPPPGHPSSSDQRDISLWKPETERLISTIKTDKANEPVRSYSHGKADGDHPRLGTAHPPHRSQVCQ